MNLAGKIAEQVRLLRRRMAVAVFGHCESAPMGFHVKIAAAYLVLRVIHLELQFIPEERCHEIGHTQISFAPADLSPLLVLGQERAVKAGRYTVLEEQFAREFSRDRR